MGPGDIADAEVGDCFYETDTDDRRAHLPGAAADDLPGRPGVTGGARLADDGPWFPLGTLPGVPIAVGGVAYIAALRAWFNSIWFG